MEFPVRFLLEVFLRSRADELVRWRAVSRQWGAAITSPDLLLQRRRFGIPVEPLLVYNLGLLFGSPAGGVVACYCPSQAQAVDDATQPPAQPTEGIVAATPELEGDIIFSILLLCRATDLVLWRGVCTQWRDIISSPRFVIKHNDGLRSPEAMLMLRRRPVRSLAELMAVRAPTAPDFHLLHIQTVEDIQTKPTSAPLFAIDGNQGLLNIYGCVDSVILLSYNGHLFAVNPVMRRGVRLPPIHTDAAILALFHGPNHEPYNPDYRVLYCNRHRPVGAYRTYSIATGETLRIACPAPSQEVEMTLLECMPDALGPPVVIGTVIYWLQGYRRMILCFHTDFSEFRLLCSPPHKDDMRIQLLEIDGGLALATLSVTNPTVDIWVHQSEWQLLYHVLLPVNEIELYHDPYDFYDYFVVSCDGHILVDNGSFVLHFDSHGVLLGRYTHDNYNMSVIPYQLKKNLLPLSI